MKPKIVTIWPFTENLGLPARWRPWPRGPSPRRPSGPSVRLSADAGSSYCRVAGHRLGPCSRKEAGFLHPSINIAGQTPRMTPEACWTQKTCLLNFCVWSWGKEILVALELPELNARVSGSLAQKDIGPRM